MSGLIGSRVHTCGVDHARRGGGAKEEAREAWEGEVKTGGAETTHFIATELKSCESPESARARASQHCCRRKSLCRAVLYTDVGSINHWGQPFTDGAHVMTNLTICGGKYNRINAAAHDGTIRPVYSGVVGS